MAERRIVTAGSGEIDMEKVWDAVRGSPADLRAKGCTVAVHNDYRLDGRAMTFWLVTYDTGKQDTFGCRIVRSFKGEGETDAEALDKIRAEFAAVTDNHHHAPMCPANHYHGMRAPTGPCTCGAVRIGVFMRCGMVLAAQHVPPGERHGLVERFGYASLNSFNTMLCRYRKRLAAAAPPCPRQVDRPRGGETTDAPHRAGDCLSAGEHRFGVRGEGAVV